MESDKSVRGVGRVVPRLGLGDGLKDGGGWIVVFGEVRDTCIQGPRAKELWPMRRSGPTAFGKASSLLHCPPT